MSGGDGVDAGGGAGEDGDFVGVGVNEGCELGAEGFVGADPFVPRGAGGAPAFGVGAHAGFGGVAEGALGAVVGVGFVREDGEAGAKSG
jgi:hypothetical protein